jgi:hypothetical protein
MTWSLLQMRSCTPSTLKALAHLAVLAMPPAALGANGDGHSARNNGQQWTTHFDGCGFEVTPDCGGWSWGLQLERFGRTGNETAIAGASVLHVDRDNVSYCWSESLTEWFVNDGRGLEHGFTMHVRPPAVGGAPAVMAGPLLVTLSVRGDLWPRLDANGRGVHFTDASGHSTLGYTGLTVFDADGKIVPAHFELTAAVDGGGDGHGAGGEPSNANRARLMMVVDDRSARYPLTIDPVAQQAYLKASNTGTSDLFGTSVALSGDTLVVSAPNERSSATGVNGDESDNSAAGAGAAYVFVRSGSTWTQQAYLKASNAQASDSFGRSVAICGDTIVVGAPHERSHATGVNGNQIDNSSPSAGAAYVFVRSGAIWSQQAYLKASNTDEGDKFGWSVAVSEDTVVVGAFGERSSATGIDGGQANDDLFEAGAAYVFVRTGSTWGQQAYLKASNTDEWDRFGYSVAASGDTILVGAYEEDSNAVGVNGNQASNSLSRAGAAYVFVRNGATWVQQAYLKASSAGAGDIFGAIVSVAGDTALIGAPFESSNSTGVNGNQSNNSAGASGAAYIFVRRGSDWAQQAYLKASNTGADDLFGYSGAISGDRVVVGSRYESSNATGVDGDGANNNAFLSGAAYLFARNGTTWWQQSYLKASNTGPGDFFGESVSLWGDTAVVGAIQESSGATGVNGNQQENSQSNSGAAYVFNLLVVPCTADLNRDGHVDGADLAALLSAWGSCRDCAADINGDGMVSGADLGVLLAAWGACSG